MSQVVFLRIDHESNGVQNAVKKALNILNWQKLVKGKKLFVKVNLISSEFVPGQCTSPLVLDALFRELTKYDYDVTFGDADLAAARQCNKAAKVWGHLRLAEKYGVRFQNLSEDELIEVEVKGNVFDTLEIPRTILEADSIISIPIIKTHCLTSLTCALKHFWGVVPRVRHQYHVVVDKAIGEINNFLKPKVSFILVDGTIGMEGNGPRTGKPKICDILLASQDPVATDVVAANYMGLPIPEHVKFAAEIGVGSLDYEMTGDDFKSNPFELANPDAQPVFHWEMKLRNTPLKPLFFNTPVFDFLAWIATEYNTFYYYRRFGKKYTRELMKSWYGNELMKFVSPC
ncbi:DUF362 domain-containing protein [Thermoproteota archaeon]